MVEYIREEIGFDSSVIHIIMLIIAFGIPQMIDVDKTARITFVVLKLKYVFFLS